MSYYEATAPAEKKNPAIRMTEKQRQNFIRAMKIGYYKEFYKQGLITAEQFELLIAMQDSSEIVKTST